jgi:hypothetical protein
MWDLLDKWTCVLQKMQQMRPGRISSRPMQQLHSRFSDNRQEIGQTSQNCENKSQAELAQNVRGAFQLK